VSLVNLITSNLLTHHHHLLTLHLLLLTQHQHHPLLIKHQHQRLMTNKLKNTDLLDLPVLQALLAKATLADQAQSVLLVPLV